MNYKSNDEKEEPEQDSDREHRSFFSRVIQPIGAVIVTAIAMWYLLGIPASILWEPFYQRLMGLEEPKPTEHIVTEDSPQG